MAAQPKLQPVCDEVSTPASPLTLVKTNPNLEQFAIGRLDSWFRQKAQDIEQWSCFATRPANLKMLAAIRKEVPEDLLDALGELAEADTRKALSAVGTEATIVFAGLALVALMPISTPAVAIVLGVRGRYVANLMHAASHRALTSYVKVDELLGHLLATVGAISFVAYCEDHLVRHHGRLGNPAEDPKLMSYIDMGLMNGGLWTKRRLAKTMARAAAKSVRRSPHRVVYRQEDEPAKHHHRRVTAWVTGLAVLGAGGGLAPLTTFLAAQLVVKPVVNLVTDVANHAGLIGIESDPVLMTRGFDGNLLVRMLFGGYQDDLAHFVHHWAPGIPWNNELNAAALILERFPRSSEIPYCEGFIWAKTSARPTVFDDIVTRLNNNNGEKS